MKILDTIFDAAADAVYALANLRVCLYIAGAVLVGAFYLYLGFASVVASVGYY